MHKALGLIPYEALRAAGQPDSRLILRLLKEMRTRAQMTELEASAVRPEQLLGFFTSALGRRALGSGTVRREWSFDLQTEDGSYLQGVIDLCFLEQGQWVLVDYKTDAVQDVRILTERYADQLSWYRRALETLTGIPVRQTLLYSVTLGVTVEL